MEQKISHHEGQEKNGTTLLIERIFNAPRQLVWKVWTDPKYVTRWWGPKMFTAPVAQSDFRVGGRYLYCMRSPDGQDYWSTGVFHEILEPERIVYTDAFADEKGNIVPASYYGMGDDFPEELLVTVTFEEQGDGKTKLILRHQGMPAGKQTELAGQGWNESLDKLAETLKSVK